MQPRLAASRTVRRRLRAEAGLGARASGPWTVPVWPLTDDCFVTAYRPALPLDVAVTRHGPLPEHALRILGAALAETLTRLHTLVPAHQGLAPHTVQLASDGPRLTGFGPLGAATAVGLDGTEPRLTLGYLTPEQVARQAPGPASDVFVLGLLLVYAATGGGPFPAATPEALASADAELGGVPRHCGRCSRAVSPRRRGTGRPRGTSRPNSRPTGARAARRGLAARSPHGGTVRTGRGRHGLGPLGHGIPAGRAGHRHARRDADRGRPPPRPGRRTLLTAGRGSWPARRAASAWPAP
ncbi:hypothetical protein O1L60_37920 [Streptomyces diastatochromogenes]|nr:hypothetical protein [Streptomyces diastatochromogenes]